MIKNVLIAVLVFLLMYSYINIVIYTNDYHYGLSQLSAQNQSALQNHIVRKPIRYVIHAESVSYFSAKLRVYRIACSVFFV